jgi:hypothetical protein
MKTKTKYYKTMKIRNPKYLNQKGIALVLVLVIALISLALMSALIYFVTQGAKTSGYYKQYGSARDAGIGGSDIMEDLLQKRGELHIPGIKDPTAMADCVAFTKRCDCGNPDVTGDNTFSDGTALTGKSICLCAKLCDPTASWIAACPIGDSLDARDNFDFQCTFPGTGGTDYQVSAKITDSIIGATDISGEDLGGTGVITSNAGLIPSPPAPYLFRFEVDSVDQGRADAESAERSRYSVLYAF